MAQLPFNATEVPVDEGFNPIPVDTYLCQVISSEIKQTKTGNGTILKLTSQVIEGPYSGRLIFDNLNISNPNADAERISARSLADLCLAVGISVLQDSEELHFKPFIGRVGIRHDKSGAFPPQNTIRYTPREEVQQVQPQQNPSAGNAANGSMPPARGYATANRSAQPVSPSNNQKPWQRQTPRY